MIDFSQGKGNKESWGYLFVIFGILFLVKESNILQGELGQKILDWHNYPIIAAIVFFCQRNFFMGAIMAGVGVLFHLGDLISLTQKLQNVSAPVVLIVVGAVIILSQRKGGGNSKK